MWDFLSVVRDSLVPFFDLFRDERVALGLAIGLILLAVFLALGFWLTGVLPWLQSLKRERKGVASAQDSLAFYDHFSDIDQSLRGSKRLSHAWAEFHESLLVPPERRPIRNTARPQAYFNIQAAVENGLPLPFFLSLPNIFVGLGLVFTFIGLVAALHFAAQGVISPNVAEAQQSLEALLKAATFKFMTSIAGVGISILMSLGFRVLVGRLQRAFDRFCQALEERLQFVTQEGLAAEQVRELEKQTLQLERFNTDFAVQLANVLDEKLNATLSASLTHAVQPVVSAVNDLAGNLGAANQDSIKSMIDDFQKGLKQSTGTEMQSLVDALGDVRATLDHAAAGLKANGADFGSRLDQVAEQLESRLGVASQSMTEGLASTASRLEQVLGDLTEKMRTDAAGASAGLAQAVTAAGETLSAQIRGTSADFGNAMAAALAALPGFERTLNTLDGRFSQQVKAFDDSIETIRGLVSDVQQASQRMREAGAPIADTAARFTETARRIETAGAAMTETQARIAEMNRALQDTFEANRAVWQEYRNRFEQVDKSLEGVVQALIGAAKAHGQEVNRLVVEMDGHLSRALSSLAGSIDELGEVTATVGAPPGTAAVRVRPVQGTPG